MSELPQLKTLKWETEVGGVPPEGSHGLRGKETTGRTKE